jgi:HSP20 family protein
MNGVGDRRQKEVEMAREMVRSGRATLEWPPRWTTVRWPGRWTELFDEDDLIRVEEVVEDDHTLVVRAELAGFDPDKDVKLSVENGVLAIQAVRRAEHEDKAQRRHRTEFRYGSFARSVVLPAGAAEDDVKATFVDGILEVRIPIDTGKPEAKEIPITRT